MLESSWEAVVDWTNEDTVELSLKGTICEDANANKVKRKRDVTLIDLINYIYQRLLTI